MRVVSKLNTRRPSKTSLAFLTVSTLAVLACTPSHAQSSSSPQILNPKSAWTVTDNATAINPSCTLQRRYNPDIKVTIKGDVSGQVSILFNDLSLQSEINNISIDGDRISSKISQTTSTLSSVITDPAQSLAKLYAGEFLEINSSNASHFKLPVQSTSVAEAKMSLCLDVMSEVRNLALNAGNVSQSEEVVESTDSPLSNLLDSINEPPAATASVETINEPPSFETLGDEVMAITDSIDVEIPLEESSPIELTAVDTPPQANLDNIQPEPQLPLLNERQLAAQEDLEPEIEPQFEDISAETLIDTDAEANLLVDADTAQSENTFEEEAVLSVEDLIAESDLDTNITAPPTEETMQETPVEDALASSMDNTQAPPLVSEELSQANAAQDELVEDAPNLDALVETAISESLGVPEESVEIEDTVSDANFEAVETLLEDFGVEEPVSNDAPADNNAIAMDDADILAALDESLETTDIDAGVTVDTEDTKAIEVSDVPLDDLASIEEPTNIVEGTNTEDNQNIEEITSLLDSEVESTDTEQVASLPEDAANDESALLFDDDLSLELAEDASVSAEDDAELVEDLANEDFSDEELLALLDDPEALADDFAEVMIEEDFKQKKPMEGVRDMLGLGTPDEIAYRKVPWLIEEDIDSQWKEKVKLLEREKEMLRLRLADTNANPLAELISQKRNKRTQEQLVEKIRALEAENKKLKKGLVLSKNAEEFLDKDLKLSDPNPKMRLGTAQPTEIDLIDSEIDQQIDSLETRMDAFLQGIGEDYALSNADKVSPLSSSSLTQDIITILKKGYVVDPDELKIRAYRHKSTGTAVTAWEAGDLQGRAERTVLPPTSDFTAYVDRFLNAAQIRCRGNFTAVPDTSTRNLRTLDIHCNDGAVGQRSSVIFVKHGAIITAIATTTTLPKGDADFLRDVRRRIIEGVRLMDRDKS